MRFTYVASDNTASDAQALGAAGQDIFVKKVIFGAATGGKAIKFYNKAVAFGHASGIGSTDSSDVALYLVQPSFAAGSDQINEMDFTSGGGLGGLPLDGGSFHTDDDKVTVIWELKDESKT